MKTLISNPFAGLKEALKKDAVATLCVCVLFSMAVGCGLLADHSSDSIDGEENSSESEIGKKIEPIIPEDDVIAFFDEHLPPYSGMTSDCFFVDIDEKENRCLMINSVEEFRKNFSCSSDMLPEIDFKSYTLIMGQYYFMPGTSYSVAKQNLIVESNKMELNLYVKVPEGSYCVLSNMYYCGIYPKIRNKSISVNVLFN